MGTPPERDEQKKTLDAAMKLLNQAFESAKKHGGNEPKETDVIKPKKE